jgi:hypothetical protein
MRLAFIRKVTNNGGSPTLWVTDRTDRPTYVVRGWAVTDPQALAALGQAPAGEVDIEIPAELIDDIKDGLKWRRSAPTSGGRFSLGAKSARLISKCGISITSRMSAKP